MKGNPAAVRLRTVRDLAWTRDWREAWFRERTVPRERMVFDWLRPNPLFYLLSRRLMPEHPMLREVR